MEGEVKYINDDKRITNIFLPINKEAKPNDLQTCFDGWKKYRYELIAQTLELEKQIDKTVFTISSGGRRISS